MEYSDIKIMTDVEIDEKLIGERDKLQKLKFSHAVSPVENPNAIHNTKKLIAKLLTEINARKLATVSSES